MKSEANVIFIDNPHAPETHITDAAGFFLLDGCVHVTMEAARVDHGVSPGPVNRVVVGRIVMPIPAAQRLALGLYDFLKSHGCDPMPAPPKDQLQ